MKCTHDAGQKVADIRKGEAVFRCKLCGRTYRAKTSA